MSFTGQNVKLAFCMVIEFPSYTLRYVEGGEIMIDGELYTSKDDRFGQVKSVENFTSGTADEAPGFELVMTPRSSAVAAELSSPEFQGSPAEFFVVSVDRTTGLSLSRRNIFKGIVDYTVLSGGKKEGFLIIGLTTRIDLFFNVDKGNNLNSSFHRSVNPGEAGLDMTTGTLVDAPWGVEGTQSSSSGGFIRRAAFNIVQKQRY